MQPVVIVGGASVGLTASIHLSRLGVPHTVYERFPGTAVHPKAVRLNERTMEIFRAIGLEDAIRGVAAPPETCSGIGWYTNLGPDRKTFHTRYARIADVEPQPHFASPTDSSICPQIRLEPVLHRYARELNPDGIINNAEVTEIHEKDDGVYLTIRNTKTNSIDHIKTQYVIACDGGRTVSAAIGIQMAGEHRIAKMVSVYFQAPITQFHPNPNVLMSLFIDPELESSVNAGILYHVGPYPMRAETEEWVFVFGLGADDPQSHSNGELLARLKRTIKIDGLEIQIRNHNVWFIDGVVAERYRSIGGRVFLAGDAAHHHAPWGALGLNTGIQDIKNLAWKLAYAIKSDPSVSGATRQYDALLQSYDLERRPVAEFVAKTALHQFKSHPNTVAKAVGLLPGNSVEENKSFVKAYFDPNHPTYKDRMLAMKDAQKIMDNEFAALGANMGWFYPSLDLESEGAENRHHGQLLENGELDILEYHPSTIPGHHLVHAWLTKGERKVSTLDLIPMSRCVLIAHDESFWRPYENELLAVEIIDSKHGWKDIDGQWGRLCGVEYSGAVVARPDGIVLTRIKTNWNVANPITFQQELNRRLTCEYNSGAKVK